MRGTYLLCELVRAGQPPHGEFDVAAGQFAPTFDPAHVGSLGIPGEEIARLGPGPIARQGEGFTQKPVVRFAPAGHPVGQIAWAKANVARARGHVANSNTDNDRLNIARPAANPSPAPPSQNKSSRQRTARQRYRPSRHIAG